jgi:hypothetical protein
MTETTALCGFMSRDHLYTEAWGVRSHVDEDPIVQLLYE